MLQAKKLPFLAIFRRVRRGSAYRAELKSRRMETDVVMESLFKAIDLLDPVCRRTSMFSMLTVDQA